MILVTTKNVNSKSTAIYVNGRWFDTVHPSDVLRAVRRIYLANNKEISK